MIYDIIIAAFIAFALWKGWRRGAMRQLISLAVIIAAVLLGTALGTPAGKAIGIGQKYLQPIVGFFIIFIVLAFAGQFLSRMLHPKAGMTAGANKLLGAIFSGIKAVVIIGLIAAFLRMFAFPPEDKVKDTVLYPATMKASALMVSQIRPLVSQLESIEEYEEMGPADSATSPPPNN